MAENVILEEQRKSQKKFKEFSLNLDYFLQIPIF